MNRRLYDDGGIVANTILEQLGGAGRLRAMTGAYNFRDLGNGLSFKIKNQRANYIKINLTSMDLYDVEVGRIRGNTYKVVQEADGLYFDQLKPFIEKATGMYLSLADGGTLAAAGSYAKGGMLNKKVNEELKNYLGNIDASPMSQWQVKTILQSALTDANFHSASKKVDDIFPKAKFVESPMYSNLQEEFLRDRLESKGREIASMSEYNGDEIINSIAFYVSMNMGRPLGQKVESLKNIMADGGMIEHETEDGVTLKYKIDEDEMSIEVDFPTMEYLSENGIVMKREARQLNDKYIFWYDQISDREQLEEVLDEELPVYERDDDDDEYAKGGELRYSLIDDFSDVKVLDESGTNIMYADGGNIQRGQSFDWLKDGVEHTISVTEVKDGMVFYRLDGRSKVLEIEDFEDFLEDNNLKAGQKFSVGGMTAGRWYKDNTGAEFRFIGKKDSGINEGKLVFNDGTGNVYKTLDDFASLPKQNKLFGFFADGGNIEQGNLDMVKNQVVQVEHHAKELMQTLKSNPQVDAWVVAKMDRATSNLSDITHYLEGEENSFANGGKVKKRARFVVDEVDEMAKGGDVDNKFYIEYLNKKKGFKRDKKFFETYEKAIQWAKDNFENFSPDMIRRS